MNAIPVNKRTDLALEVHELNTEQGKDDGIITREENIDDIIVTTAEIKEGKGEELSGKSAGIYITVDVGRVWQYDSVRFNKIAKILSNQLKKLLPEGDGTVLIAGLGNENITADSIGPKIIEGIIVSHHIKVLNRELYDKIGFSDVAAFAPGVLGQTGIESAEIIKSVAEKANPSCIIVIDALSSRRLARLATTVQIADSGIAPGSGVNNSRARLDKTTLGVPVISIGIPTVVDAATLAYDLIEEVSKKENVAMTISEEVLNKSLTENSRNFFITPKETDVIIKSGAKLLSTALNMALHKNLPPEEIPEYL
ncbi:MAG: hypothetical protein A2Y17_08215 [Clostridiales bacterium GWF2_38_85]|nr:MAG: hypothetical protein A2Y17_08215 [Clostridiales bacterium GWF2_38_85]HBL83823.1 GPR endopeptidase [Clostridiales bacterium]